MTTLEIQYLLNFLGYDTGGCDGIHGKKTRQAILDFQADFGGLTVDGKAGEETQKALRHAVAYGIEKKEHDPAPESGTNVTEWDEIEYFVKEEFKCTCGGRFCDGFPVEPDMKMVRVVNEIRKHFGVPFTPNSAIRCAKRNAEVGGVSNSRHLNGDACDITVPGHSAKEVAAYAETLLPNTGGIGIYSWGIHVDTRETKSRWNG